MCFLFDIDNKYFVNLTFSTYFIFNNINLFDPSSTGLVFFSNAFVAVVDVDVDDDDFPLIILHFFISLSFTFAKDAAQLCITGT